MLAVVDDEEELLGLERGRQGLDRRSRPAQSDAQDLCDDGADQLAVTEWSELGEPDAVGVATEQVVAGRDRKTRLADPAGAGQRHQPMPLQPRRDLGEVGVPADQAGQLLWKIVPGDTDAGGRGRRCCLACRRHHRSLRCACALHRGHEAIAAPGDGDQEALAVARARQYLAQRRDVHLDIVLLHHHAGPDLGHQLILGDQLAVAPHQRQQDIEGALAERHRHAVRQQLASRDQQTERSELEGITHRRHPGGALAGGSRNWNVSRLRPLRRS